MTRRAIDWPKCAAELAQRVPSSALHPAVAAWAGGSGARVTWQVGFSGGADSLALLLLLWAHWPARRGRLVALHFDHRLRGRASRADGLFCGRVCQALGIKLVCGEWREAKKNASEAEARVARLAFFAENSRRLWLGHQQDDVAETQLMRLARGSGTAGLAAPRPVQRMPRGRLHVRPLLTLKKTEIVAALRAVGAEWREDASNGRGDFFRNRIRLDVLPAWIAAAQRDALAGAARSRELLEEDDAALEAWLGELRPLRAGGWLDLAVLKGKPRALQRRALHGWLLAQSQVGDLSRQAFELLLDAIERGTRTRQSVGNAGFAVVRDQRLDFEPAGKSPRRFRGRPN